ncbi:MAG: zf-HC2 domain-containing protein [Chloroflexi bacterium]|nr:zf-HC2 domain-containing protein [Chloroflexota bacterium]
MITCEQMEELLPLFIDGDASSDERKLVEDHLGKCEACRRMQDRVWRLNAAIARLPVVPERMQPALSRIDEGVRGQIRQRRFLFPHLRLLSGTLKAAGSIASVLLIGAMALLLSSVLSQVQPTKNPVTQEGASAVRLPASDVQPPDIGRWSLDWSPGAQALAYASKDGVFIARAPDFTPVRLAQQIGTTPLWSTDGKFVAFSGFCQDGDAGVGTVWLAAADGSSVRDLLPGDKAKLSVSTNKLLVAWVDERTLSYAEGIGTGVAALATVDVQNGEVKAITARPYPESQFPKVAASQYNWSPNRRFVVADAWGRGLPTSTLLDLSNGTGSPLTSLGGPTPDYQRFFQQFRSWAPDSQSFVYAQWPEADKPWPILDQSPTLYLWDMRKVDANRREIGTEIGEVLIPNAYLAVWSPDGKQIAFLLLGNHAADEQGRIKSTDFQPGQPFPVYMGILDVTSGRPNVLIPMARSLKFDSPSDAIRWFETHAPSWTRDGSRVAYLDEGGNAFAVAADGKLRWQLSNDMPVRAISWSTDGRFLATQLEDEIRIVPTTSNQPLVSSSPEPIPSTPTPTRVLGKAPAPTPTTSTRKPTPAPAQGQMDNWKTFSSSDYGVTLRYPLSWESDPRYTFGPASFRYRGIDGFFTLSASNANTIDQAAEAEANHKLRPYGSKPTVAKTQVQGQDARLIMPSNDQPAEMDNQAALIILSPRPIQIVGTSYKYLVLWADKDHIEAIAGTLLFASSPPTTTIPIQR